MNIDHLPLVVQGKIALYVRKLLDIHADNVLSVLVYGSALNINFVPKASNVNIAVVFKSLDFTVFQKSLKLTAQGRKERIAVPLFLTVDYIRSSLDVFPIEFSEIKGQHCVIYGEDVFASMVVDVRHMRLLCEAQVKGKLLRVRQAYLESQGDLRALKNILKDSLGDLIPVFRQLIVLSKEEPSLNKEELLKQLATKFAIDTSAFIAIQKDKSHVLPLSSAKLEEYLRGYLLSLEQLSIRIDSL